MERADGRDDNREVARTGADGKGRVVQRLSAGQRLRWPPS